jgi:hypothetical protein
MYPLDRPTFGEWLDVTLLAGSTLSMGRERGVYIATLLPDGRVLVAEEWMGDVKDRLDPARGSDLIVVGDEPVQEVLRLPDRAGDWAIRGGADGPL